MSLEEEFSHRGVMRGGILILSADGALAMVERARELGVPVLGVDEFWITESTTQPDLEHSLDLGAGKGRWDEAAAFIAARAVSGLMFEVVAGED